MQMFSFCMKLGFSLRILRGLEDMANGVVGFDMKIAQHPVGVDHRKSNQIES